MIADPNEHVRAEIVRSIGQGGAGSAGLLRKVITDDPSDHVRHLAAIAAGKQKTFINAPFIEEALQASAEDPVLRHSLALGLSMLEPAGSIGQFSTNASPAVRMGVLLAWRRLAAPEIASFLSDNDPALVVEAARAIHDMPIESALAPLASIIDKSYGGSADSYDALLRRVLNANFRLGKGEHAAALTAYAGRKDAPEHLRIEALDMLGAWAKPSPRDRVLGSWRPLGERDGAVAADALRRQLASVFSGSAAVRRKAAEVASALGVKEVVPELVRLFLDNHADATARAAALAALGQLNAGQIDEAVKTALGDKSPELRIEARRILARRNPAAAIKELKSVLERGTTPEKQAAFAALGVAAVPEADKLLTSFLDDLAAGRIAAEVQLDLVTAVRERLDRPNRLLNPPERQALRRQLQTYDESLAKDSASAYRLALAGGDAARGRAVFFEKVALSCVRCHKVSDVGGEVGPDLTKIAADKTREYLLESLVDPNKAIARGFETAVLTLDDGRSVSGIVKNQTDKELTLVNAEAQTLVVATAEILERTTGQSAMPADLMKHVTLLELRDLVEYLSTLR
jgi:quinoprotein glucose dehydrogenase